MKSEIFKKIGKWVLIIIAVACVLALGLLVLGGVMRYENHKSTHRDDFRPGMGGKNFFFDGRDCNEMANVSDEEIKDIIIKKEILGNTYYQERVRSSLEADSSSLDYYNKEAHTLNEGDLELREERVKCIKLENKILKTLDDLNMKK